MRYWYDLFWEYDRGGGGQSRDYDRDRGYGCVSDCDYDRDLLTYRKDKIFSIKVRLKLYEACLLVVIGLAL